MLTVIFCGIAAYLLYKLLNALFSSPQVPQRPHSVSSNINPAHQSDRDLREMQLMEQQRSHDNKRAAVAGLTGALAGAALAHHLDQDNERDNLNAALAAQQQQEANNISAADDANMSYDEFMNTDRTYDDNGNVIDYDDNNDMSDDDDDDYDSDNSDDDAWSDSNSNDDDYGSSYDDNDHDSWGGSDDSSFFGGGDDGGFFGGGDDGGDGGDWF